MKTDFNAMNEYDFGCLSILKEWLRQREALMTLAKKITYIVILCNKRKRRFVQVFSILLEHLHKRREGKGGKDHVIEVRHSCTRRTAMCTRINKNKNDGDRPFWLSLKAAHKSHVTLHVKSNAEKVNSPTYLRSLIKLSHNYPYSFRQVVVVTSTLASLQRNEEYQTKQREALAGLKGLCNIADRVLTYGCEYNRRRMCLALALVDGSCKMISLWHLTLTPCR